MDKVNMFFSTVGIIFAVLGITKILSYDVSLPIMHVCLGVICLNRGVTEIKTGKKGSAIFDFLLGTAFLLLVIVRLWRGL